MAGQKQLRCQEGQRDDSGFGTGNSCHRSACAVLPGGLGAGG